MSSTEDWNEDDWFAAYEHHKNMWDSVREEHEKQTEYNKVLAEDEMYHYSQMMTCAEHLKHFGIDIDLPRSI